jgi:hypothetical protein
MLVEVWPLWRCVGAGDMLVLQLCWYVCFGGTLGFGLFEKNLSLLM